MKTHSSRFQYTMCKMLCITRWHKALVQRLWTITESFEGASFSLSRGHGATTEESQDRRGSDHLRPSQTISDARTCRRTCNGVVLSRNTNHSKSYQIPKQVTNIYKRIKLAICVCIALSSGKALFMPCSCTTRRIPTHNLRQTEGSRRLIDRLWVKWSEWHATKRQTCSSWSARGLKVGTQNQWRMFFDVLLFVLKLLIELEDAQKTSIYTKL